MPVDLDDAETGGTELYFADDLQGLVFDVREAAIYTAEEVRDAEGGDVPKFGNWLPITDDSGSEAWAVAVSELVEELQRFENPQAVTLEVTRCQKSGVEQTDPYEVNVVPVDGDPQQDSL